MTISTLIGTEALEKRLGHTDWVIVDCRFALADPDLGHKQYNLGHIPGAVYAHLDHDLSGPLIAGVTGRHPLPDPVDISQTLSAWGIDQRVQVVAYDDSGGMIAARLWWMLQWLGHRAAAVLDGGWAAWIQEERPVDTLVPAPIPRQFEGQPDENLLSSAENILRRLQEPDLLLIDARGLERYSGREEPIDALAGRIPGAKNLPHTDVLGNDGKFRSPRALKEKFGGLLAGVDPREAIFYCGSGVSAARDLLAMTVAGLPMGKLYAGSWSHWITDPSRPMEKD